MAVTDAKDRRLCNAYLLSYVREELLDNLAFFPKFEVPPSSLSHKAYCEYIEEKLAIETPAAYGLHPNSEIGFMTRQAEALFGAVGGIVGAFCTTPVDVVITRMFNERRLNIAAGLSEDAVDTSPIDTARAVYADSGVPGFFVGAKERVLYWGPAISIFLTVYCRIRQYYLPDIDVPIL